MDVYVAYRLITCPREMSQVAGWEFITVVHGSMQTSSNQLQQSPAGLIPVAVNQLVNCDHMLFGLPADAASMLNQLHTVQSQLSSNNQALTEEREQHEETKQRLSLCETDYQKMADAKSKMNDSYMLLQKMFNDVTATNKQLKAELEEAVKDLKPLSFETPIMPVLAGEENHEIAP